MEQMTQAEQTNFAVENESDLEGKYLTFLMDAQLFAVPIAHVVQIVSIQTISEIPDSVNYLKGVITLRGSIIPVIDVRLRLGKPEKAYDDRTCIVVVSMHEKEVGLIVDEVDAVIAITEENISPPPQFAENKTQNYLLGIGKLDTKVVLLMDTTKILSGDILV